MFYSVQGKGLSVFFLKTRCRGLVEITRLLYRSVESCKYPRVLQHMNSLRGYVKQLIFWKHTKNN